MLLNPMMAEVEEELEGIRRDRQDPLSQTIEAHTRNCAIDPVKNHAREKLPEGTYQNYFGFLIKDSMKEIEVDERIVEEETTKLRAKMVIGYFVGKKPSC
jgi:hypothetical protein